MSQVDLTCFTLMHAVHGSDDTGHKTTRKKCFKKQQLKKWLKKVIVVK